MIKKSSSEFFLKNGYSVIEIFNNKEINAIIKNISSKVLKLSKNKKIKTIDLKNYHKIDISDEEHNAILKPDTRLIKFDSDHLKKIKNNKSINDIISRHWDQNKFIIKWGGSTKLTKTIKDAAGFRIARPIKKSPTDVAGVHLDLHFGGELRNNYKDMLTIWVPLIGLTSKYTLRFAPKSHLTKWPNSAISKQKKYVTPVFKDNFNFGFKFIRLNFKLGQAIIFHPNLLHGGSGNYGKHSRVSIDFRIFNNRT